MPDELTDDAIDELIREFESMAFYESKSRGPCRRGVVALNQFKAARQRERELRESMTAAASMIDSSLSNPYRYQHGFPTEMLRSIRAKLIM